MQNRKQFLPFKVKTALSLAAMCATIYAQPALANPLTFTGQNAALFNTANPNDTAAMMNSVVKPTPKAKLPTALDQSRLIIQGLTSQLTTKIYNDIFTAIDPNTGLHYAAKTTLLPDGGSISFVRNFGDGTITITIVDSSGNNSVVVVPDI